MTNNQQRPFKTIGVLGGIGPEATLDLYRWIIKLTPANRDQDHIPTLIYSLPQIPDRSEHLLNGGDDPLPSMIHAAQTLEKGGADFIVIPCNTAHADLAELQLHVGIPIIDMIGEAAHYVKRIVASGTIGLLATTGTIRSCLYEDALRAQGLDVLLPDAATQDNLVMEAIYGTHGIKAGYTDEQPRNLLIEASQHLIDNQAQVLIMGCTEIPLALDDQRLPVPLVNPTKILAQVAIDLARGERDLPQVQTTMDGRTVT